MRLKYTLGLLFVGLLLTSVLPSYAQTGQGVTAAAVNVRERPTTSAAILQLVPQGTVLTITGRSLDGAFYQVVTPSNVTGWASARYIFFINPANPGGRPVLPPVANPPAQPTLAPNELIGIINTGAANVRVAPDPLAQIVRQAPGGEQWTLTVRNTDGSWYGGVFADGAVGWVYAPLVIVRGGDPFALPAQRTPDEFLPSTFSAEGLVDRPLLNMRLIPSPNGFILGQYGFQTRVRVVGRNVDTSWILVEVNGERGWMYAPFVKPDIGSFENAPIIR